MTNKFTQKLLAALLIALAFPVAYASGNPIVLYLMSGEILALLCGGLWALLINRPWRVKLQAFFFAIAGLLGLLALNGLPKYFEYQGWIEGASIFVVGIVFFGICTVLRRAP